MSEPWNFLREGCSRKRKPPGGESILSLCEEEQGDQSGWSRMR